MGYQQNTGVLRRAGGLLVVALLVTGCGLGSGDGGEEAGKGGGAGEPTEGPSGPSASPGPTASRTGKPEEGDPGRVPRTREQALRLARAVVAEPVNWGAGYVRGKPYRSGPDRTSELSRKCVWSERGLRAKQFVSITRRSELPAEHGTGTLRTAAVVIVYRDQNSADWAMARAVEDALRCPDQQLSGTERVTGLVSGMASRSSDPDDPHRDLVEMGLIHTGKGRGESHPYAWMQYRIGSVVLCTSVKGAEGHDKAEVQRAGEKAGVAMLTRAEKELGVEGK